MVTWMGYVMASMLRFAFSKVIGLGGRIISHGTPGGNPPCAILGMCPHFGHCEAVVQITQRRRRSGMNTDVKTDERIAPWIELNPERSGAAYAWVLPRYASVWAVIGQRQADHGQV